MGRGGGKTEEKERGERDDKAENGRGGMGKGEGEDGGERGRGRDDKKENEGEEAQGARDLSHPEFRV